MQLIQDVRSGDHDNDFTGTQYVPVYVMLAVSVCYSLLASLICFFEIQNSCKTSSSRLSSLCIFLFMLKISIVHVLSHK